MIITCPRCSTRYVIDPAVLVPNGRAVGCSNCGHHWTQAPSTPASTPEDAAPPAHPEPPASSSETPPEEVAETASPLEEIPPEQPPDTETEIESGDETEPSSPPSAPSTPEPADPAPLEPPGTPDAPEDAVTQTIASEPDSIEETWKPEGPEDPGKTQTIPTEPEPIPAALREGKSPTERGKQNQKKKPSIALLAGIGALVALIVIVVVFVVARGPIVSAVPGAAGLYRSVGLLGDEPGAGLEIRDVRSARQHDGADEILTIEGIVGNVTDQPLELPAIRVSLSDADGEELQFVTVPPKTPTLPPGETMAFEARIVNPSAIVRRVKVKFTSPDGASTQEGGGGH